jgi:MYXO-CTERM domain-containing protein
MSPQKATRYAALAMLLVLFLLLPVTAAAAPDVSGELRKWHPITLTFDKPQASESDEATFLDYRMTVTFTHASGTTYAIPGFFAADGSAADTGATDGDKWRVHFTPDQVGDWSWTVEFVQGDNAAIEPGVGTGTAFDGESGTLQIADTDKSAPDHRGMGMLRYTGGRYLTFDDGTPFIKGGADSPENLLAYEDFDDTPATHRYAPHKSDWNAGDPTWDAGRGKALIGALNYLAGEGMRAFSFLTMNVTGDGDDVWPWTSRDARRTFDVSKLAQWDIVFRHSDTLGLFKHFKTQETENDQLLDGGDLGVERKLYYRELIARFAYHHALNWNLGEEYDVYSEKNDGDQSRLRAYADYIHELDPYDHPVVVHTYPGQHDDVYPGLLGFDNFEGPSIQLGGMNRSEAYRKVRRWVTESEDAGRAWNVSVDEPGNASVGVSADDRDGNYNHADAIEVLWAVFMAGGDGVEWYFGYQEPNDDLDCEDWRSRSEVWDFTRHAMAFFDAHVPVEDTQVLSPSDANDVYVLGQPGVVYVVFMVDGARQDLDLSGASGDFEVKWYDPRSGGALQDGTVTNVSAGGNVSLGEPPSDANQDWVALVRVPGSVETYALTVEGGSGGGSYPEGAVVQIEADAAPDGQVFDRWTGDTSHVASETSASTSLTMPAQSVTVRATYREGVPTPDRYVRRLQLVDADADELLSAYDPFSDGATINLATLPSRNLDIVARTEPATVGSVEFSLDGSVSQVENQAPYVLNGDSNGDYAGWTPTVGSHEVTARPFSDGDASGEPGDALSVGFEVIDDANANVPPLVSFLQPDRYATFDAPAQVPVELKAADPDGQVTTVTLTLDGRQIQLAEAGDRYTADVEDVAAGTHTLEATATDDDGDTFTATYELRVTGDGGDAGPDADASTDAGGDDAGGGGDDADDGGGGDSATGASGGCNCSAAPNDAWPAGWLLLAACWLLIRRRRAFSR